jgi:ParB/RepB/Spo0J family partition protein
VNETTVINKHLEHVPLTDIYVDEEFNCRGHINAMDVADLAKDIAAKGLIQPISLIPTTRAGYKYQLIAGFRRFLAHRVIKATTILAVVSDEVMSEVRARLYNLSENIQRKNLDVVQEAKALSRLRQLGLSEANVADELGTSRGWVQIRYMLLALPEEIWPDVMIGNISQTQIRQLYAVMQVSGKDSCFNIAKKMKEDRSRGVAGRNYVPHKPSSKRVRGRAEIMEMINYLYDNVSGINHQVPMCRALAWASGEISDADFHQSLKLWCDEQSIPYSIPVDFTNT